MAETRAIQKDRKRSCPLPKQMNKTHTTKSCHPGTIIIDILKNIISKFSLDVYVQTIFYRYHFDKGSEW